MGYIWVGGRSGLIIFTRDPIRENDGYNGRAWNQLNYPKRFTHLVIGR